MAAILPESENIRQAWRWAVEHGEWAVLGRALSAWRSFYHLRCLYAVATQQAQAIRPNEPIVPHNLYRLADLLYCQGEYAAAETYCQRGLAILREHGHTMFGGRELTLWTTTTLAQCWYAQGRREEGRRQLLALLATADDPAHQAKIQAALVHFV